MTAPLRAGLAGLGIHGMRYARHLLAGDVPGLRLTAVSRRDAAAGRAFASEHGLAFEADAAALAARPDVDVVIAVLEPAAHAAVALAALDARKPVLVEKPMAHDLASAETVAARARTTGVPLMVAQTLRFDPLVLAIRREAASLGPIRMISVDKCLEPTDRPWTDAPGLTGGFVHTGVHGFDLLRFLSGGEAVSIVSEAQRIHTLHAEDQFASLVRIEPGGILGVLQDSRGTDGRSGAVAVACERGQVRGDHIHRTLHRIEGRTAVDLGPVPEVPTVVEVLRAFAAAVAAGGPCPVTADDGLASIRMADAATRSARSGYRVPL